MKIAMAVVIKSGKVLVQKRFRSSVGMIHEFPGGKADDSESFENAAHRELFEETGMLNTRLQGSVIAETQEEIPAAFVILDGSNASSPRCIEAARQQEFFWMPPSEIPLDDFHEIDKKFIAEHLPVFCSALPGNSIHWIHNDITVSTCLEQMDISVIHGFLSKAYWSIGVPAATVEKAMDRSLCFGVYKNNSQIGFARVVTDSATFAWLADVFILPEFQGNGYSKFLMHCIMNHPSLKGLRRFMLATRDAHKLYEQYGFSPLCTPEKFMEISHPGMYRKE